MSFVLFFVRTYALCTTCTAKRNEMHKVDYFYAKIKSRLRFRFYAHFSMDAVNVVGVIAACDGSARDDSKLE